MSPPKAHQHLNAVAWTQGLLRAIFKPRPRLRVWKWIDAWVHIPESSGGPSPGRMRTSRFPIFRGLYDLASQRGVHFLTLCSSARAGKTLFCICLVLYWISERFGAVVWLDPTRNSARKLVRDEVEEFLLGCPPVRALAIITKTAWTLLEKCFRGRRFRIVGSGAEADLHGFNAELAIENELDACRASTTKDAASADKIEARTKLFASSRLIVRNSTPQAGELGPIWQKFLLGTQHHCYLPCPHCSADRERELGDLPPYVEPEESQVKPGWSAKSYDPWLAGWQRLTFFAEKRTVPFTADLQPLLDEHGAAVPRSAWREEVTGQFDFSRFAIMEDRPRLDDPTQMERVRVGWNRKGVRRGTVYECAHCKRPIEQVDQSWMLARYRWMAHNPEAEVPADADEEDAREDTQPDEHVSAHVWSAYSPFEIWGVIADEFLQAKGNLGLLIKFWVYTLGRPFIREGTAIKEDDLDRVIARCPVRYVKGQLPMEPELLTITVDRQGSELWYVIRAHGIYWDHPERPTWSALIDWGPVASNQQILEVSGHAEDASGTLRRFRFTRPDGTVREYLVTAGLYDCGFEQQAVWDFCLTQPWLSPSKGGDTSKTGGNLIRQTKVMDEQLDLIWFWSDFFASDLYYSCIREGKTFTETLFWWLPINIDSDYRKQLCDEYQHDENGKRVWTTRTKTNHLGDCEKNQRVLAGAIEQVLDNIREARTRAEDEAAGIQTKG